MVAKYANRAGTTVFHQLLSQLQGDEAVRTNFLVLIHLEPTYKPKKTEGDIIYAYVLYIGRWAKFLFYTSLLFAFLDTINIRIFCLLASYLEYLGLEYPKL